MWTDKWGVKGLEIIHSDAFACCVSLKNIKLPSSVKYIGDDAFSQ